jgi:hypothetical protein
MCLFVGLSMLAPIKAQPSVTYHVNAQLGSDDNDGQSSALAWRTIAKANDAVQPGDTVLIYSGVYTNRIAPARSGTAQMRISYRAVPGETVIIEGDDLLLELRDRSYITIEGITFRNPIQGWGEIQNGTHNELIGNKFRGNGRGANAAFAGIYLFDSSYYNRIVNNAFQDWGDAQTQWGDAIELSWGADNNLIEGNRFVNAGHSLIGVETSFNIIRSNYLENAWQKGIDVVWRISPPWAPGQEFVARRNVIEDNTFVKCRIAADGRRGGAGIQMSGAQTIFRRNLLMENEGGGITLNGWEPDAPKPFGSRIYHNTIAANGVAGNRETSGLFVTQWGLTGVEISDTVLKNNIFYRNAGELLQLVLDFDPPAQYGIAFFRSYQIAGNCITRTPTIDIGSLDGEQSVLFYQEHYPQFVASNLAAEPLFVDPAAGDYRLRGDSPCVDAGVPLTATTSAGSGATVPVADAAYFTDGYGLVPGDQVKVGSNPAVRLLSVDYTANTLTLAEAIAWSQGDPVCLGEFSGSGPDIGAFEVEEKRPPGQGP